jgi:GNAT superfamily N-acetyltransferase
LAYIVIACLMKRYIPMEWKRDEFLITDDTRRVDVARTFDLLAETYWAIRRPPDVVANMVKNSLCLTLLRSGEQIGFGRAVTDYTVFSWIADIVIDARYRRQGLGKWMMACIAAHPAIAHTQMVLQTRDAHSLYERFGFQQNAVLMSTKVDGL